MILTCPHIAQERDVAQAVVVTLSRGRKLVLCRRCARQVGRMATRQEEGKEPLLEWQ